MPDPSQSTEKDVCAVWRRKAVGSLLELLGVYSNLSTAIVERGKFRGKREREGGSECGRERKKEKYEVVWVNSFLTYVEQ